MFSYSEEDERKDYEHMIKSRQVGDLDSRRFPDDLPVLTPEELEKHRQKLKEASQALWFRTVARSESIERRKKEDLAKFRQLLDESNIDS